MYGFFSQVNKKKFIYKIYKTKDFIINTTFRRSMFMVLCSSSYAVFKLLHSLQHMEYALQNVQFQTN